MADWIDKRTTSTNNYYKVMFAILFSGIICVNVFEHNALQK